ncbi:MAG TPA: hypothetical protein VH722_19135 [Alphaproteobacteria bacterium]|nr:hypothetical protein [Alphaproteobacteria bacterium]
MTDIGKKIPDGEQPDETWFNLYSQQFKAVMQAANSGDMQTACEKAEDLDDWVDRNPPPR